MLLDAAAVIAVVTRIIDKNTNPIFSIFIGVPQN